MTHIAALDPGRSKCGLVLVDTDLEVVLEGQVVQTGSVLETLEQWRSQAPLDRIVMGNGTASEHWSEQLPADLQLTVVDERGTTLLARSRYWELWPPRGWRRLLPEGLRIPPCDLDAVAALVILESALNCRFQWPAPAPPHQNLALTVKL
ncbi:resolvase [Synechococcus sp. PROS-7-1]|uniref:resolvase n=1 Tax=Synechococcus sp. PROS-7-1 TaxID=1442556 RepID=UPI00351C0C4F